MFVFTPLRSVSSWPNFISVGIVDISFQSTRTGKYATPTGHLNFHWLRTLSGKLRTFPAMKRQQYTPVLFKKSPYDLLPEKELPSGLFRGGWLVLHNTVHVTPL